MICHFPRHPTIEQSVLIPGMMKRIENKIKHIGIGFTAAVVIGVCYGFFPGATVAVIASAIRQSTPLALGALCGLMGERSGIINIGIEGQMLTAAFIGFLAHVWTGDPYLGILMGLGAGMAMGLLLALMAVTWKMDQIIGGTVINILALGITGYLYQPGLSTQGKLQVISLGVFADIPLIGPVLFDNPPITYLTPLLVIGVHCLHLRSQPSFYSSGNWFYWLDWHCSVD